jgi:hypothetical protein
VETVEVRKESKNEERLSINDKEELFGKRWWKLVEKKENLKRKQKKEISEEE